MIDPTHDPSRPTGVELDEYSDERRVIVRVHGWPVLPKRYGSTSVSVDRVVLSYRRSTAPLYGRDRDRWTLASAVASGKRTRRTGGPSGLDADTYAPVPSDHMGNETLPDWLDALYARCRPTGPDHPAPILDDVLDLDAEVQA